MKIGIITAHWPHNYGAVLQAYALSKTLVTLGHECEIIDFMTPLQEKCLRLFPPNRDGDLRGRLRSLRGSWHVLTNYRSARRRYEAFENFKRSELPIGNIRYRSHQELLDRVPPHEAFICGSDQIWRSIKGSTTQFDPSYYLCFAKNTDARRIAYAPSFGADSVPEELKSEYRRRLLDIQHLSVRENHGRDIIRELTGKDVPVVLDPTLLLPEQAWRDFAVLPHTDAPYILVYLVSGDRRQMGSVLAQMKQKLPGSKAVVLASSNAASGIPNADRVVRHADPKEFLGWFAGASAVCTSSFHGMVFSYIFRKPFVAIMPHRISSRLVSLADRLGLTSRLLGPDLQIPDNPLAYDFSEAERRHAAERDASLGFLKNALAHS